MFESFAWCMVRKKGEKSTLEHLRLYKYGAIYMNFSLAVSNPTEHTAIWMSRTQ